MTQSQILCALVYPYERILDRDMPDLDSLVRARRAKNVSIVLASEDARLLRGDTPPFIRSVQTLRGHKDVRTTMIYTHVLDRGPVGVVSPLDR